MRRLFATFLCVSLGTGALAGQKIYEGEEAVALRCANMIALTGVAILILERHLSGTPAQKLAALRKMQERRTPEATLDDYRNNVQECMRRFPIN